MKTAQEIIKEMKADKRLTPSRSRSHRRHRNYSNPYTRAMTDYDGINSKGYFTKFYPYGTVGHCCIFAQAHLIWAGYGKLVPHKGYIWNTNNYARWLKSEPTIKGLGKVIWTNNPKKARDAARAGKMVIVFKGHKGHKFYTHTCALLDIEDGYVKTVDGNVTGKYKGKKINNGVIKKRKLKSYRWGFAILPIPTRGGKSASTKAKKKKSTNSSTRKVSGLKKGYRLNVRQKATKKSNVIGRLNNGDVVVIGKSKGGWTYIPKKKGWVASKYLKKG